jgi:transposase-like protein
MDYRWVFLQILLGMISRKLSDSDKQQILELYRLPGETTSTLASRYGVSNSTISRILKSNFSEDEYESLIQQKRVLRSSDESSIDSDSVPVLESKAASEQLEIGLTSTETDESAATLSLPVEESSLVRSRRSRKRSTVVQPDAAPEPKSVPAPLPKHLPLAAALEEEPIAPSPDGEYAAEASAIAEILGEDFLDQEEDLDEDDLEDFEEDDLDEDDLPETSLLVNPKLSGEIQVQVLPLAEATLPRSCYLVVDRSAELVARPLRDFADLGSLPEAEVQAKTLPIFDNHRVAKRFSNPRTQRVIKLPDSRILQKTTLHLQAKGITHLLIDGQIYAL